MHIVYTVDMTTINIRIDEGLKLRTAKIFKKRGLDMSTVFRMLLIKTDMDNDVPIEALIDTKKLKEKWDREVEDALKNSKRYTNVKELFADLNAGK